MEKDGASSVVRSMDLEKLLSKNVLEGLFVGARGGADIKAENVIRTVIHAHVLFDTIGNIQHIGLPTSPLGKAMYMDPIGKIDWCITASASADARIDRKSQARTKANKVDRVYLIQVSVGAIVRIASLCSEAAAVILDDQRASQLSSLEPPGLFVVLPDSAEAKHYADVLTWLTLMLLFGHEVVHALDGHSDYDIHNPDQVAEAMKQLEQEADQGAGMFLISRILNLRSIREFLGYATVDGLPNDSVHERIVGDSVVASLVLSAYFQSVAGLGSERYDRPLVRFMFLLSGFKAYLAAEHLPVSDDFKIAPRYINEETTAQNIELARSLLAQTSAANVLREMFSAGVPLAKDSERLRVKRIPRSELEALRPFGLRKVLADYEKARKNK